MEPTISRAGQVSLQWSHLLIWTLGWPGLPLLACRPPGGRVDSPSASIGHVLGISGPAHKCFHGASPLTVTVKREAGVMGWADRPVPRLLAQQSPGGSEKPSLPRQSPHRWLSRSFSLNFPEKGTPWVPLVPTPLRLLHRQAGEQTLLL